jgi:hypothetical protein
MELVVTDGHIVEQAKGFLRGSLDVSLEDALGLLDRYARTHGSQLTEVSRSLMTEPHTRPTILAIMRELIDAPS